MSVAKIQKGDKVKVIAGNYKGTIGIVSKVVRKKTPGGRIVTKVAVSGIPAIVDYRRSLKMYNLPGQMNSKERLIDVSNVRLVTDGDQVSRVGIDFRDGKKIRVYKKTGEPVVKQVVTGTENFTTSDTNKTN